MKGFTPMKNGRKDGFQFPSSFGFSGSSGKVTLVDGYTRRKFADGGPVRREGRMTVVKLGDVGRATVPRNEPTTAENQASGGKTPLRAGYKKGGALRKAEGGKVATTAKAVKGAFKIFSRTDNKVVGKASSRAGASRVMDRKDNEYGSYNHYIVDPEGKRHTYAKGGRNNC